MGIFTLPKASNFNFGINKRISEFISKDLSGDQSEVNVEMIGDYSGGGEGTTVFAYRSKEGEYHVIERLIIQVSDQGQIVFDKFGKNTTLSAGVVAVQGVTIPSEQEEETGPIIKTNKDWAKFMAGSQILTYDAGKEQMYIEWNLIGQGIPAVLDGDFCQYFGVRLTEDFSDIDSFTIFVHGFKMSKAGL